MCSFLLLNITDSSDKRVLEQSNTDWETAKTADNIIEMFKLLCSSHNFYGKTASLVEKTAASLDVQGDRLAHRLGSNDH